MSAKSEVKRKTHILKRLQHDRCILCNQEFSNENALDKRAPVLDHCHESGFVRGALCRWCNSLEGMYANDNDERKKIEYAMRAVSDIDMDYTEWILNLESYLTGGTQHTIYDRDNPYMEISQNRQKEINQNKKASQIKWRKSFKNDTY